MALFIQYNLQPKRMQMVHSYPGGVGRLVLLECIKNGGQLHMISHKTSKMDTWAHSNLKVEDGLALSTVLKAMVKYHWPGNIRELKNYIARGVILSRHKKIRLDDLPDICTADDQTTTGIRDRKSIFSGQKGGFNLQNMEKEVIQASLEHCAGNKSHAAQQLGISRKTLYEKIARYGIK